MLRRKISFAALILTVSMSQDLLQAQAVPDLTEELRVARQTLSSPQVQRAFEYVEGSESETVQEWLSLCNAYGPSGEEIKRSRLLFKLFRIYGLENVHIDDALNVIGVRPGVGEAMTGRRADGQAGSTGRPPGWVEGRRGPAGLGSGVVGGRWVGREVVWGPAGWC